MSSVASGKPEISNAKAVLVKIGVSLSMIGSAVGFGNMWRFPEQAAKFGGLAYMLIYVVAGTMVTWPLVCLEIMVGQFGRGSMFDAGLLTGNKRYAAIGVGFLSVCALFSFYSTLLMWVGNYLIHSTSQPWYPVPEEKAFCDQFSPSDTNGYDNDLLAAMCNGAICSETVEYCACSYSIIEDVGKCTVDYFGFAGGYFGTIANENPNWTRLPTEEEIANGTQYSGAIENINWENYAVFAGNSVLALLSVLFGDRVLTYVMYATMGPTVLILLSLFIYFLTLPGAGSGLHYYVGVFAADDLVDINVWKAAINQCVFSCSLGSFLVTCLSSMRGTKESIGTGSMVIVFSDLAFAVISGFIVFSMLGYLSEQSGVPVLTLLGTGGGGLIFVTYSSGLSQLLDGGKGAAVLHGFFWFLFYLMGFTSYVTMAKTIVMFILDTQFVTDLNHGVPTDRNQKKPGRLTYLFIGIISVSSLLLGMINASDWGSYLIDLIDNFVSGLLLPLTAGATALMYTWCMNTKWYQENTGYKTTIISRLAFCFSLFLPGVIRFYKGYGDETKVTGITFLICAFVLPTIILLGATISTYKTKGVSFSKAAELNFNGYFGVVIQRHLEYISHDKVATCRGGLFPWVAGILRTVCTSVLLCLASDNLGKPTMFFNYALKRYPDGSPVPLPTWVAFAVYFFPFAFMFLGFMIIIMPDIVNPILATRGKDFRGLFMRDEYAFGLYNETSGDTEKESENSSDDSSSKSSSIAKAELD